MRKHFIVPALAAAVLLVLHGYAVPASKAAQGEQAFEKNCTVCHKDGGNIINPAKTLHKKDLEANGITKPADIIAKMRNPGPGMTKFDRKAIPDKEAGAIADYILKAFR
jgi:cytochrome c6